MGNQINLKPEERKRVHEAADAITCGFDWQASPEGHGYWEAARDRLREKAKHGTTDGQPWREPEAEANPESESEPIADVVCVIESDNNEAVYVDGKLRLSDQGVYVADLVKLIGGKAVRISQLYAGIGDEAWPDLLSDLMLEDCPSWKDGESAPHATESEPPIEADFEVVADAEPEPVIDDKWAAVWPRRWVMCRDGVGASWEGPYRLFGVAENDPTWPYIAEDQPWAYCRPATAEEIATVEPKEAEPAKSEIGEGYRQATGADSHRSDRDMRDVHGRWVPAHVGIHAGNYTYRVPIDREPTVEDAKDQPDVMAWDMDGEAPILAKFLNRVDGRSKPFICTDGIRIIDAKFASHLRSYE